MADEAIKKPDGEQEKKPDETTSKTVSEIIEESTASITKKDDPEMVPLASLMEVKNDNKEMKRTIKDLQEKIDKGGISDKDIAKDVEALAKKYDVEPGFATELLALATKRNEIKPEEKGDDDATKKILEENGQLKDQQKRDLIDKAFKKHFGDAIEKMPEYAEIADADTIKALSLLPQNAKKTFPQLIEETYGKAIQGKRTIDPVKPGGGKDPEPLDMDKARSDTEYFKEIMADPAKKAEYNKRMIEPRGRRS